MKANYILLFAILSLLAIIDVVIFYSFSSSPDYYVYSDSATFVFASIAVIPAVYAFIYHGLRSMQGKAMLFMAGGGILWAIAEFSWFYQEVIMKISIPHISISDVFYYAAYALFFMGFYYIWKITASPKHERARLATLIGVFAFTSIVSYSIILPQFYQAGTSLAENIVNSGYTILDLMIFSAGFTIVAFMYRNKISVSWSIIILGFLVSTFADVFYAAFPEKYISGDVLDLLWQISYIIIAFGYFYYMYSVKTIVPKLMQKRQ